MTFQMNKYEQMTSGFDKEGTDKLLLDLPLPGKLIFHYKKGAYSKIFFSIMILFVIVIVVIILKINRLNSLKLLHSEMEKDIIKLPDYQKILDVNKTPLTKENKMQLLEINNYNAKINQHSINNIKANNEVIELNSQMNKEFNECIIQRDKLIASVSKATKLESLNNQSAIYDREIEEKMNGKNNINGNGLIS